MGRPIAEDVGYRPDDTFAVVLAASILLASLVLAASVLTGNTATGSTQERAVPGSVAPAPQATSLRPLRDPRALMLAATSRDVLVGLAVRAGGPIDLVIDTSGEEPIPARAVRVRVDGRARPVTEQRGCGAACFRIAAPVLAGSPSSLSVRLLRPGRPAATVRFRLPARLPPSGTQLQRTVTRVMGALRSVSFDQTLSSGLAAVQTRYAMQAPDRMRFETSDGAKTIIIGRRRWDWQNGRWSESPFPGLRAPNYPWQGASRPRILGSARVRGVRVRVLALFKPDNRYPTWFRLFTTNGGRVLRSEMLASGHFMTDRYRGFNVPVQIEPPR